MDLTDERWTDLRGGYREIYDPRDAIRRLETDDAAAAWVELWEELHHQGDVGEASYAAVRHFVRAQRRRGIADWNGYGLAAIIELARRDGRNPPVPEWLQADYDAAWVELQELAIEELPGAVEEALIQSILAVLALGKGLITFGRVSMLFSEDELRDILVEAGWA